MSRPYGSSLRGYSAAYLARQWNRGHDPEQSVEWLQIVLIDAHRTEGTPSTFPRRVLWSGDASRWEVEPAQNS